MSCTAESLAESDVWWWGWDFALFRFRLVELSPGALTLVCHAAASFICVEEPSFCLILLPLLLLFSTTFWAFLYFQLRSIGSFICCLLRAYPSSPATHYRESWCIVIPFIHTAGSNPR